MREAVSVFVLQRSKSSHVPWFSSLPDFEWVLHLSQVPIVNARP